MKNITLILIFAFINLAQCQTANIITETEFNAIEINGIDLISIKNTLGNQNAIETLFGLAVEKIIDPDGEFTHFEYDGFSIGFSAIISGGTIENPILGGFKIKNNNYNITIQGVTFTVGDNISLLGDVVFNIPPNNINKNIVYQYCDGCNNFISIRFDQSKNIITEIIYIEQT